MNGAPPPDPIAALFARVVPALLVAAAESPEALGALRKIRDALAADAPEAEDPTRLLSKRELAAKLSVSVATIDRLCAQGMPIAAYVGDSRRFDLAECRAWLAQRGKKATAA